MAHAQKPDFAFRRNGRVNLNRRGRQFSRLLAAEVCASAVVMLDTPCSEVVWGVLATYSIRQFSLHFPSRASPCAFTFQLDSAWCAFQMTPCWPGSIPTRPTVNQLKNTTRTNCCIYPLSYRVPVRERYGSTLLPATREQHDQNCTQSH